MRADKTGFLAQELRDAIAWLESTVVPTQLQWGVHERGLRRAVRFLEGRAPETTATSRPQPSPRISHNEHLRELAHWAGIEWRRDSMHVTAENAIRKAADYKDQIERRAPETAPDDRKADEVVTQLYRRFKDWSQRGFTAEDVTWCEVKADILSLIRDGAGETK